MALNGAFAADCVHSEIRRQLDYNPRPLGERVSRDAGRVRGAPGIFQIHRYFQIQRVGDIPYPQAMLGSSTSGSI